MSLPLSLLTTSFSALAVLATTHASHVRAQDTITKRSNPSVLDVGDAAVLETISVEGRAQKLYRVPETKIGKVADEPLNIAQSLQIIPRELIDDQRARDVTDLYRNISGLSFFSYSGVTFRGFRRDTAFYDGLRGNPFVGFAVPQLYNVERVEFVKGPAGMLYGPGSPGGIINYVTKKPKDTFSADLRGIAGNYGRYGASADVTGPLNEANTILARGGLFYEDMNSFRTGAESKNFIGDGGLSFLLTDETKLTLQGTAYNQRLPGNGLRGVQVDMEGNFLTPISWNHNEATDFLNLDAQMYQARLESEINDDVTFDLAARWYDYVEAQNYHQGYGTFDTDNDGRHDATRREFRDQVRNRKGTSLGTNIVVDTDLNGIRA